MYGPLNKFAITRPCSVPVSESVCPPALRTSTAAMTSRVARFSHLMLAMLAASCLPGFEAKSEHLSRGECLACQDECDGRFCPKVCAGKTAEGDDMTCALDTDCLDNSIDPYGGMGCNVRR